MHLDDLELLAQGREAEVYLRPDGTVVKLMRSAEWGDRVALEESALAALAAHGFAAPKVVEVVSIDGRPGLAMERVPGTDLLSLLASRPWSLWRAGRSMGSCHAAMHDVVAPPQFPDLHDYNRERVLAAPGLSEAARGDVLELLGGLPRGDRLCHGDLHLGNVLGTFAAPVVIDWGNATRGDPVADVARSWVLMRFGEEPPGTPFVIRAFAPMLRGRVLASYFAEYRRCRPFAIADLRRWQIVQVAARLAEGIGSEAPALLEYLTKNGY
ncbi:MAG TPA: aminoglycoside phosphotransferase family protein [Acidimicrobiales bacterium]|nr:aminoglycoside phosphotransferase family protein [Acidimicrobiales bacterium]